MHQATATKRADSVRWVPFCDHFHVHWQPDFEPDAIGGVTVLCFGLQTGDALCGGISY